MYKVLLADDEPLILAGLQKRIDWAAEGFTIAGLCHDGRAALEGVARQQPDLLLIDIRMPVLSGLEVLQRLPETGAPAVVVVSGFSDFAYAQTALRHGVVDYVLKPVSAEVLLGTVRGVRQKLDARPRAAAPGPPAVPAARGCLTSRQVAQRVQQHVESNFAQPLSLKQLAEMYYIDMSYLSAVFHNVVGQSFVAYLTSVRIRHAQALLQQTSLPLEQVAAQCGFSSYSYFYRVYKKATGQPPMACRKNGPTGGPGREQVRTT